MTIAESHLDSLPRPASLPIVGNVIDFMRAPPWEVFARYARDLGPMCAVQLFGTTSVILHDPEAIETVLSQRTPDFIKTDPIPALLPLLGTSTPFVHNGPTWKRKRELNPMSAAGFDEWQASKLDDVRQVAASWARRNAGERFAIDREATALVFDCLCTLVLGECVEREHFEAMLRLGAMTTARMKGAPFTPPSFGRLLSRWMARVERVAARAPDAARNALIDFALRSTRMPRADVLREMSNVMPGGLFSVAATMAHTLVNLGQDPPLQAELRASLQQGGAGPPHAGTLLDGVIRETMRVTPPVPITMRAVDAEGVTVRGVLLPKGTKIYITCLPLHRDASQYASPERFEPRRWTEDVCKQHPFGSAYFFPFGRGPRECLGGYMAMFVLRTALAEIVRTSAVTVGSGPVEAEYFFGSWMPARVRGEIRLLSAPSGA